MKQHQLEYNPSVIPAMATMGVDDLVTIAEDLYGDGPDTIFRYHVMWTLSMLGSLTAARFWWLCPDWVGRGRPLGHSVEAAEVIS